MSRVGTLPIQNASSIFLEATSYNTGNGDTNSIAVADVNGDGKPDLLVANCASDGCNTAGSGTVSVLLGNGDGTFQPPVSYDTGGTDATSVVVSDINGDGKSDLVVANLCSGVANIQCFNSPQAGGVAVLFGNGDGTFEPAVSYSSGGYFARSVMVADLNGDRKPDIVVTNSCSQVVNFECSGPGVVGVLLATQNGSFRPVMRYNSGGVDAVSIAIADVNGDQIPDLIVANSGSNGGQFKEGSVGVLLGSGNGNFQAAANYAAGGYGAVSVAVADVNLDGNPDLIVGQTCEDSICLLGGTVGILLGNGTGSFGSAVNYGVGGGNVESLIVADLTGDGKPDVIAANGGSGDVGVLMGNGDGTFQNAVAYSPGGQYAFTLAAADVNGDGKLDLMVLYECDDCTDGTVAVLLGEGNGTFYAAPGYSVPSVDSIVAVDVNGDGKLDLVMSGPDAGGAIGSSKGGMSVLLGKGDGTFLPATNYVTDGFYSNGVAVGDLNGDGKPDVMVSSDCLGRSNCQEGTVSVYIGKGDGTFRNPSRYLSGGGNANGVATGDLNGDGKPDMVVANNCAPSPNCGGGVAAVFLGNGDGTFRKPVLYNSGGYEARSITLADVNGDGKLDLIVTNCAGASSNCGGVNGAVSVLLGNGDGTFRPAVSYSSGGVGAVSAAVGDMNGDGKLDLVVSNECTSTTRCDQGALGVLLGNGDGTFRTAIAIATPESSEAGQIVLGDFNGDGKMDIAASGEVDYLLLGNGDGTFQPYLSLGMSGAGIAVGDFNRDGKPDLAVGGVTILLNHY